MRRTLAVILAALALGGVAACGGDDVDRAVDDASDAAQEAGREAEEAGRDVQEAGEDAANEAQEEIERQTGGGN